MLAQYQHGDRIAVALDCIIFGFDHEGLKLLLVKRDLEPERGRWALMGGLLHKHESLEGAAQRVLHQLTGLKDIYLEQLHAFGAVDRDPVERTVSVAYYALINIRQHDQELMEQYEARWFPANEVPALIFDHGEMVDAARERLRHQASYQPIGFELLPEKFTMPELQRLYEAIYDMPLDKRNFHRRILSMHILQRLDEKQKGTSKKGAYLYQFNQDKYHQMVKKGFTFVFKPNAY